METLISLDKFEINKKVLLSILFVVALGMSTSAMQSFAYDQPWNGNKEDITTPEEDDSDEDCEGDECGPPDCNNTGSPVYTARGYLVWADTDITFTANTNVDLKRTYNSFDKRAGLFGRGWVTSQEKSIARTYKALTEGNADNSPKAADEYESVPIWMASYGRRYRLEETETGCNTPSVLYFTFEKTESGGFKQVFENSRDFAVYDVDGRLTQEYSNRMGLTTYYKYDDTGRLYQQVDSNGFELNFEYNDVGFVEFARDQAGRAWRYTYDEYGRLSSVLNPDGNSKDYGYKVIDKIGYKLHLLESIDDNVTDHVLDVVWSEVKLYGKQAQRVKSYTDINGYKHEYTYSGVTYQGIEAVKVVKNTKQINSTSTINAQTFYANAENYRIIQVDNTTDGVSSSKTYNDRGKLTALLDKRGNTTVYEYDDLNRRRKVTELAETPEAKITTIEYLGDTDKIDHRIEYGELKHSYIYDDFQRVLTYTQTDLNTNKTRQWSYTYHDHTVDAEGNVVLGRMETTDGPQQGAQDTQTYAYNGLGQPTTVTHPLGLSEVYGYNTVGQLETFTGLNGVTTTLDFDSENRLKSTDIGGRTTTYKYDGQDLITSVKDALGRETVLEYDSQNQVSKLTHPQGSYETFDYVYEAARTILTHKSFTATGTLLSTNISTTKADTGLPLAQYLNTQSKQVTLNEYNNLDELKKVTQFGQFGSKTTAVTTFKYDAEGRLDTITDDLNGVTDQDYDDFGRITRVTDANQGITQYGLNAWGDMVSTTSPDTGVTTREYTSTGKLKQLTDAENRVVNYQFDALDRLKVIDYQGEDLDVLLAYDGDSFGGGRLTAVTDGSGSSQYGYDDRGLLTDKTNVVDGVSLISEYAYNTAGQVTSTTYPSGLITSVNYDGAGRVSGINVIQGSVETQILKNFSWHSGRIDSYEHGNGVVTTYAYDQAGRLTGKSYDGGNDESFSLTLDNQGNIQEQVSTRDAIVAINHFEYDTLGRLKKDGTENFDWLFSYDSVGNRTSKSKSDGSNNTVYTHKDNSNRLATIAGQTQTSDLTGNLLNDGVNTLTYDAMNRLSTASNTVALAQYTYNYAGERVHKVVSGGINQDIRFVYGQSGELLGEYDFSGNRIREIIYHQAEPVAQIDAAGVIVFIHTDHLATPRIGTDSSKTVVWRWVSGAFGDGVANDDADGDGVSVVINQRFPGQYLDLETGFYYNYFRDYDPGLGRYIQSDPIGLQGGINTYAYVSGNPLSFIDPKGLYQMCHRDLLLPIPMARHCYLKFGDGSTSSYDPSGVNPDPDPNQEGTVCTEPKDPHKDDCIKKAMQKCNGENYNFTGFNCCHCAEQAMKECGTSLPPSNWPNWPFNPGPQPGEPGYSPDPIYDSSLGG